MNYRILETMTGPFVIMEDDRGRLSTSWLNAELRLSLADATMNQKLQPDLARRLARFFEGKPVDFSDIKCPQGSDFFVRCWKACRRIPRGQTRSYAELAIMAGSTAAAARAAGQAMRHNSLPIIIPCHRVIGSTGQLHGFGGSCSASSHELAIKNALLNMEGALTDPSTPARRTSRPARRRAAVLA